jgi:hypothetical protein
MQHQKLDQSASQQIPQREITTGIMPDPPSPVVVTCTAGHPAGPEVFGTLNRRAA